MLSNEEQLKRKQIIQHALADELSPEQVQQAVVLWEALFHDSPTFVSKVFQFTNELTREFDLTASDRLKIMTNLVSSFNLLKDAIVINPQDLDREQEPMTDDFVIFNVMLAEIIVYIQQQSTDDMVLFKQYLIEDIPSLDVKPKAQQVLLHWCQHLDKGEFVVREAVSHTEMAVFMDLLYEELCDLFGANQTDSLFSTLVEVCEKRSEAKRFSPHKLI